MAIVDDEVKFVIDSNKSKNYERKTIEMFNDWLEECPVKFEDVTSNELEAEGKVKTIDFTITKRK